MPRFDGTGPQREGPMTGRGEGYCALPLSGAEQAPNQYAEWQGTPVRPGTPGNRPVLWTRFTRWLRPRPRLGRTFGRGRGRGGGRGRGRGRW